MNIELQKATIADKSILRNLLELYQHDLSPFEDEASADVDAHGLYGYKYLDHYWSEQGRYAFIVRVSGQIAGFALVRVIDNKEDMVMYSMAEFFIMRKYRRQNVGRMVAHQLFDMFQGNWHIYQLANHLASHHFWRTVIGEYTQGDFEEVQDQERDGGPIQRFSSVRPVL